jgi:hypothetical protein
MNVDLSAANDFMAAHARILDRRRFELLNGRAAASAVLAALRAYRNPDGGYGHGLEPDLRAPESQPAAALHAFEVFAEVAPVTAPEAAELCDWLDAIERLAGEQLEDGGWTVDFQSYSPAAALEWRGYATVRALSVLRDNAMLGLDPA